MGIGIKVQCPKPAKATVPALPTSTAVRLVKARELAEREIAKAALPPEPIVPKLIFRSPRNAADARNVFNAIFPDPSSGRADA